VLANTAPHPLSLSHARASLFRVEPHLLFQPPPDSQFTTLLLILPCFPLSASTAFCLLLEHMSSVPARTGRQRQRYEDNLRLVSG